MNGKTILPILILIFNLASASYGIQQNKEIMELEKRMARIRLNLEDYPPPAGAHELKEIFTFPSEELEEEDIFFYGPQRITKDPLSNIYVLDNRRNEVFIFSPSGQFQKKFGRSGQGPGELIQPYNLMVTQNSIVVSEVGNMRVQFFDFDGLYQKSFKIFKGYYSMVINDKGLIIGVPVIRLPDDNLMEILSQEGEVVASFGKPLDFKLSFRSLNNASLALSRNGEILLAFRFFPIIRKYSLKGDLLAEFKIKNEILKAKEKINLEGHKLRQREKVAYTSAINAIKTFRDKIYILYTTPRLEILEINNEGEIEATYWTNVNREEGFSVGDFIVLDQNDQIRFYVLQRIPQARVIVFGKKSRER